jgi:hypothetical protein
MLPGTVLPGAAAVALGVSAACAPTAPVHAPAVVAADTKVVADSGLLGLALLLFAPGRPLASVWHGFDITEESFALVEADSLALLFNVRPPPGAGSVQGRVPAKLRERGYWWRGTEAALRPHIYRQAADPRRVGIWSMAERPAGEQRIRWILHEQFHRYQFTGFRDMEATTTRDGIVCPPPALDTAAVATPQFIVGIDRERRILTRALAADSGAALRQAVVEFLNARYERTHADPGLRLHERRLERFEGSAEYVERVAASRLFGAEHDATSILAKELGRPFASLPETGPEMPARQLRWWLYATGAAQGILLDRLGSAWQQPLAAGASFDELLAAAIGWTSPRPWRPRPEPVCRPLQP